MDSKALALYPKLQTVLSSKYRKELLEITEKYLKSPSLSLVNMYSVFVDVAVNPSTSSNVAYSALDIRNDVDKLNFHLSSFIGFLYEDYLDFSITTRYDYARKAFRVFSEFASRYGLMLRDIKLATGKVSEDALDCIDSFRALNPSQEILSYYDVWSCESKEGKQQNIHLATIHDCYGKVFTERIHSAIRNYTKTLKHKVVNSVLSELTSLLNEFTRHCKSVEELEHALKSENSTAFMENIFNSMIFTAMINGLDIKGYTIRWSNNVNHFTNCFINTNIFEEPLKPFLIPEFKSPEDDRHSISIGGKLNDKEEQRWLVDIPLEIKDEEALNLIRKRLTRDLDHIRIVSHKIFIDILERHKRNLRYIDQGEVKPLPIKGSLKRFFPMGVEHLDNTVATFYHYAYGLELTNLPTFYGFPAQTESLVRELNLPTISTLNALISLLVLEHPKITPSWLESWELFDRHGNQVGFKQVSNQWLAVSFKNRKGATKAQQEVILNAYSRSIVELLIEHTCFARESLKGKGGDNWRYVLLTSNLKRPERPITLGKGFAAQGAYQQALAVNSYSNKPTLTPYRSSYPQFKTIHRIPPTVLNRVLTITEAEELASIVTPRSIRKARGLQIYLETQSLKAVSEALGHKDVKLELLGRYLPRPLMDFFNQRWIRQFQNGIIYEALKESPYLFDALDFDESKLEEFLCNHGLHDLPENLKQAGSCPSNQENQSFTENMDELVFTLSIPLFQVLIAIQTVIDKASLYDEFKPVVERWYQSAIFILSHFSLDGRSTSYRRPEQECIPLYEEALNNPLDIQLFKENLLCH
ncbi:hypothetical protein [Vibrio sp. 1F279]|uniref:hypothetical protein n=1 Tax=unclassified Vibrio TaxID=2614977 RepID=UPI00352C6062